MAHISPIRDSDRWIFVSIFVEMFWQSFAVTNEFAVMLYQNSLPTFSLCLREYEFLFKTPTHGYYNKIFCDKKIYHKKMIFATKGVRVLYIYDLSLCIWLKHWQRWNEVKKTHWKMESKTKSLFYYFLMLRLIFQHILHIRAGRAQLWYLFSNYIINLMICDRFLIGFLLLESIRYGERSNVVAYVYIYLSRIDFGTQTHTHTQQTGLSVRFSLSMGKMARLRRWTAHMTVQGYKRFFKRPYRTSNERKFGNCTHLMILFNFFVFFLSALLCFTYKRFTSNGNSHKKSAYFIFVVVPLTFSPFLGCTSDVFFCCVCVCVMFSCFDFNDQKKRKKNKNNNTQSRWSK